MKGKGKGQGKGEDEGDAVGFFLRAGLGSWTTARRAASFLLRQVWILDHAARRNIFAKNSLTGYGSIDMGEGCSLTIHTVPCAHACPRDGAVR